MRSKQTPKFSIGTLVIAVLLLVMATLPVASAEWTYHKPIEIDHNKVAANLADFPVLIDLASDDDLASHAQDDGDDIVFTDGVNSIKFDHEIEYFNGTTGELQAWVRIPSLSSTTNTTILMWYGNSGCGNQEDATGVWDDNYKAVWHLLGNGTTSLPDATSNSNDGTKKAAGEPANTASGQIAGAQDFDGLDDYVDENWKPPNVFTLSMWYKLNQTTGNNRGLFSTFKPRVRGSYFAIYNGWTRLFYDGNKLMGGWQAEAGVWTYLTVVSDGTQVKLYRNGELCNAANGTTTHDGNLHIGRSKYNDDYINGTIDEVRISASVRSGDWISTTYNNTHSPSAFYTIGVQSASPVQPVPDVSALILFASGLMLAAVCFVYGTRREL